MADPTPDPSLDDVLASIGRLLLAWGWLEAEIETLLKTAGVSPHPTAPVVTQFRNAAPNLDPSQICWLTEVDRASVLRNLVAHSLVGARSHPSAEIEVRLRSGVIKTIPLGALIDFAEQIDLLRLAIRKGRKILD